MYTLLHIPSFYLYTTLQCLEYIPEFVFWVAQVELVVNRRNNTLLQRKVCWLETQVVEQSLHHHVRTVEAHRTVRHGGAAGNRS